ncbi:hypothetical protein [Streptomyces sp. H51]|uniref:hypothetical protein n=1 Tax=Streptomyces sp. H51 TaxID=3111770 RepID=UPI002D76EC7C|nr:hypothetical protein [Streptomyces sp. H51]
MATADHRRGAARDATPRWTRAVVVALLAALAVLVHHDTAATTTHVPSGRAAAPMHHAAAPAGSVPVSGHPTPAGGTVRAAVQDDAGACSGTAIQHCSAAGVDSVKLVPPDRPAPDCAPARRPGAAALRDVPGTVGRAPPDLRFLSRFLL